MACILCQLPLVNYKIKADGEIKIFPEYDWLKQGYCLTASDRVPILRTRSQFFIDVLKKGSKSSSSGSGSGSGSGSKKDLDQVLENHERRTLIHRNCWDLISREYGIKITFALIANDLDVIVNDGCPTRVALKCAADNPVKDYWKCCSFDATGLRKKYEWILRDPLTSNRSKKYRLRCWLNYQQYRQILLSRCKQINNIGIHRTITSVCCTTSPMSLPSPPEREEIFVKAANGEEYYGNSGKWSLVIKGSTRFQNPNSGLVSHLRQRQMINDQLSRSMQQSTKQIASVK